MARWMVCALVASLVALEAQPAAAADSVVRPTESADRSFEQGKALLKDKRYTDACPKFEESQREDPASGTLLALAYCQELSGLLATSWTNYLAAAQLAEREGQPERQTAARERAAALANRVSRLTVVVPAELLSLPGFHLLRDGIEFERASMGVPVPTDGGSHAFLATAPGRVPWSSTVTLLPEHDQKTLVLPVLDARAESSPEPHAAAMPPLNADRQASSSSDVRLKQATLALGGAALVAVGVGTAFGLSARSKNDASNADGHCDSSGCDSRGIELRHSAQSAARVSTWAFVAGGALAATAVTLYLSTGSASNDGVQPSRKGASLSLGLTGATFASSF